MIIPDVNLLIFAHDERARYHREAHAWWKEVLISPEPVGLPWVVILAFTRLMTHPSICENPLSIDDTRSMVMEWLRFPNVRVIHPSDQALARFFDLLESAGSGGNLSTDALIALHAMEHSATVYSNDGDFARFAGVKWKNPL